MKDMRTIEIEVDPPEMVFVDYEEIIMLLDTIKLTPKANLVEYFGKAYYVDSDGDLKLKGRIGMQKFDKLNSFYDVDENNEYEDRKY